METLNDRARLERYMKDLHVEECFRKMPRFLLLHYLPGELLTTPFSPGEYLQFIAEGDLILYDMPDESRTVMLQTNHNRVRLVGEMELMNSSFEPFFVEAGSHVYTLAVYLETYRDQLLNDPVFLRYVCSVLSDKLAGAVRSSFQEPLKTRVVRSLRHGQPGDAFEDIGGLAERIGVSSRQLLRVLKSLCEDGILVHEKKGVYRMVKKP